MFFESVASLMERFTFNRLTILSYADSAFLFHFSKAYACTNPANLYLQPVGLHVQADFQAPNRTNASTVMQLAVIPYNCIQSVEYAFVEGL